MTERERQEHFASFRFVSFNDQWLQSILFVAVPRPPFVRQHSLTRCLLSPKRLEDPREAIVEQRSKQIQFLSFARESSHRIHHAEEEKETRLCFIHTPWNTHSCPTSLMTNYRCKALQPLRNALLFDNQQWRRTSKHDKPEKLQLITGAAKLKWRRERERERERKTGRRSAVQLYSSTRFRFSPRTTLLSVGGVLILAADERMPRVKRKAK